jgi:phosphate transport system substrate-binding protein
MSAPNQQPPSETIQRKGSGRGALYAAVAVIVILIVVIGGLYAAGYIHTGPTTAAKPGTCASYTITGAGSTFVQGLMTAWTGTGGYSVNTVDYDAVGSGTGISDITTGTVTYGASDAPLNATQAAAAPNLLTMPETAGAVAVIFNLPGVIFSLQDSLNLTGAVLAAIYLGDISWWNNTAITSLNPGVTLPTQQISVWHRSDGSGTSYAFSQFLSDSNSTWKNTIGYGTLPAWPKTPLGSGAKGSSGIAGTVKETPYSLGYVDLGYAYENGVSYAAVENPSKSNIIPTVSDAASAIADILATVTLPLGDQSWSDVSMINAPGAGDYPITTFSYLLFYQEGTNNPTIKSAGLGGAEAFVNFLDWTISASGGQSFSGELYYVPLPASVVTADEVTIASMTYSGGAIPACS